jgi:hypothetical protein
MRVMEQMTRHRKRRRDAPSGGQPAKVSPPRQLRPPRRARSTPIRARRTVLTLYGQP